MHGNTASLSLHAGTARRWQPKPASVAVRQSQSCMAAAVRMGYAVQLSSVGTQGHNTNYRASRTTPGSKTVTILCTTRTLLQQQTPALLHQHKLSTCKPAILAHHAASLVLCFHTSRRRTVWVKPQTLSTTIAVVLGGACCAVQHTSIQLCRTPTAQRRTESMNPKPTDAPAASTCNSSNHRRGAGGGMLPAPLLLPPLLIPSIISTFLFPLKGVRPPPSIGVAAVAVRALVRPLGSSAKAAVVLLGFSLPVRGM